MAEPYQVSVTVKPLGLWQLLEIQIRMKGWKGWNTEGTASCCSGGRSQIRVFSCVVLIVNNNFSGTELFYGDFFATAVLRRNGSGSISPWSTIFCAQNQALCRFGGCRLRNCPETGRKTPPQFLNLETRFHWEGEVHLAGWLAVIQCVHLNSSLCSSQCSQYISSGGSPLQKKSAY